MMGLSYPLVSPLGGRGLQGRKFFKNRRGIDTIIASLMMVVIVVIASVMVFTYATGLFGALLIAPKTATENISLEYASFPSSNSAVNLYVRNTGSTPITLTSYYVKDDSGKQYARTSWSSAPRPLSPTGSANATVLISSSCGSSFTSTGTAFTFSQGQVYTVVLVSARNTQFSLSVTR